MLTPAEQRVLEIFRNYTDREGQPPLLKAMSLEAVLRDPRLWRCGRALPNEAETIPSGFAEIDALLPGGGWPRGALVEILTDIEGIGALRLAIPALAHLSQSEQWLAWIAPPHLPYGPALAAHGVDLARMLLVWGIESPRERFWALEQSCAQGRVAPCSPGRVV